jgi:hypothetical protein
VQIARRVLALVLCCALLTFAQGNSFDKVRYNGGSVATKVKPDDWDNKLTVTSEMITFTLMDGQSVKIPPKQVTSLSYGEEAHRRVGTAIGLAVLSLGVGLIFLAHKTKLHYIGVNYLDQNGGKQGLLLQGDKSNFRAIIVALQGVTGVAVAVGEKERGDIPAGIPTEVATDRGQSAQKPDTPPVPAPTSTPTSTSDASNSTNSEAIGTIAVTSNPDGADIYADSAFIGNAPATLKLKPGKHSIRVSSAGYQNWSREITVQSGSEAKLTASLEKQN